jgi:hypothetical protein
MKNEFVVVNSKKLTAVTFTPINFRGLDMTYFDSKKYADKMCVFANKKDTKSNYVVMTVEDWERVSA